jgi:arylsulfatase A-like enzyme/Tfp pilus assembly protein PilF
VRALLIAIAAFAVTLLSSSSIPAQSTAPNILLVTIDTLRADRLGAYGYAHARTPTLDALAAAGVRFADATAHAPLTYPSHASILTGRYPGAFGVRLNGMDPLPSSAVTIAERLKGAGYRTGATVASVVLDESYGLAQGFDEYDDSISGPVRETMAMAELQRRAAEVTPLAQKWIQRQQGPWFLWVHYYDPHLPYEAPAPFDAAAAGRPYDAEIAYVDAELAKLLKPLDRSRTVIIVTSDHGEGLGDHGEADHGFFLYDATLRVPLIVAAPSIKGGVVREQVRLIDVAPTIASFAELALDSGGPDQGESLRPLLEGRARREVPISLAESWYPRLHFGWSELRSGRVGEWKYIAAPKPELYDLRSDPAEMKNVVSTRDQVAGRLAADLQKTTERFTQREPAKTTQPDAATVQRLQALGYVGTFSPVTSGRAGEDPKDHVADYRRYRDLFNRALGQLGRGNGQAAAAVLQQLVKLNVRAFEAHLYLGNAYLQMGRTDPALAEYEIASQLNPSLATPYFEAAKAFSAKGDTASAIARGRRGLEIEPDSFYGHYTLGVVHQKAGQWQDAFAEFEQAVALNANDPRARANLASAALRTNNLEVARTQFEAMIELGHQIAPAHYNLGVIAARRGDRTEAERRYKLALRTDPTFKPARDALAKLK